MAQERDIGEVEAAYRAWIDSLGAALTLRQHATVAQILACARMLDASPDEPLSAKISASRELRMCADELRDAGHVGAGADDPDTGAPSDGPPPDGVADLQAARRRRVSGGAG